ncbi:MAG: pimeloyl-ACP methyl ester carboxylesterase [Crocinitomix sp.]|jgi:pimeloyl-ACP methyl ester carboxylesterase
MKKTAHTLTIFLFSLTSFSQTGSVIENKATLFSIEQKNDTIDFIVVDTLLNKTKPVFLWCQGSLPIPLFCEIPDYGYYFLGGGVSNFDYKRIVKNFHLVVISMPKTPVLVKKENLNSGFEYIPNPNMPNEFLPAYVAADYLENYVERAAAVLKFLKKQKWVSNEKLILAGHSQGTKIATKIAIQNKKVTHLGLFAANPFGRIDQYVREARLNAQLGTISWARADSLINDNYAFYNQINNKDSISANPSLKAWKTFTETYYDDWLSLNIPIYLAYGTEDRTADLCDIIPLFFIEKNKNNLTLKRYLGLEHNFFELSENGRVNHEKGHWNDVMMEFINWVE